MDTKKIMLKYIKNDNYSVSVTTGNIITNFGLSTNGNIKKALLHLREYDKRGYGGNCGARIIFESQGCDDDTCYLWIDERFCDFGGWLTRFKKRESDNTNMST